MGGNQSSQRDITVKLKESVFKKGLAESVSNPPSTILNPNTRILSSIICHIAFSTRTNYNPLFSCSSDSSNRTEETSDPLA